MVAIAPHLMSKEASLRLSLQIRDDPVESYALALILMRRGAREEAEFHFREAARSQNKDLRAGLANWLVTAERMTDALTIYKAILSDDRDHVPSLIGASVALFMEQEFKAAESFAVRAERIAPDLKALHKNNLELIRGQGGDNQSPALWWPVVDPV